MSCAPLLSFLSIDMGTDELQDQLKAAGASETEGAALAAAEVAFAALYDKAVAWRKAQGDGGPLCGAFVCIAMHEKVAMHAGRRQTFLSPAEAAEAIDILVKDLATQTGKGWEKALEVWQPPAKALACWPIIAAVREASAPPPLLLGPTVPRLPMRPLACTLRLRLKRRWGHAPSRSDGSPWRAISFLFFCLVPLSSLLSFVPFLALTGGGASQGAHPRNLRRSRVLFLLHGECPALTQGADLLRHAAGGALLAARQSVAARARAAGSRWRCAGADGNGHDGLTTQLSQAHTQHEPVPEAQLEETT